jgi:electron transport complex protein RnfG
MEQLKNNYIVQAWLVLLLALVFGSCLSGVNLALSPRIQENKVNETKQKVPELVLGADMAKAVADGEQTLDVKSHVIEVKKKNKSKYYNIFQASRDGKTLGWVAKLSGQGYADKIEILLGFDAVMDVITGLYVLEQKETPGLVNKIADISWRNQFIQKKTANQLEVVKTKAKAPNEIAAITGATISSVSVCTIINNSVNDLKQSVNSQAFVSP